MNTGEFIYRRRKELGLTLEQLGSAVGVSKSTVKKWESGAISNMRRDKIPLLAKALDVSAQTLIGGASADKASASEVHMIPVLGTIACGSPIYAQENIEGYVELGKEFKADFALRCKGDSMTGARIYSGDIVFIREQPTVGNGEIAAVVIGDEATLKRVYYKNGQLTLVAANPAYEPMVYSGSDLDQIRIIGKAVFFIGEIH